MAENEPQKSEEIHYVFSCMDTFHFLSASLDKLYQSCEGQFTHIPPLRSNVSEVYLGKNFIKMNLSIQILLWNFEGNIASSSTGILRWSWENVPFKTKLFANRKGLNFFSSNIETRQVPQSVHEDWRLLASRCILIIFVLGEVWAG